MLNQAERQGRPNFSYQSQAKIRANREAAEIKAKGSVVYRRLLGYVKPYWKKFALGVVAMAVFAASETSFAAIMKSLVDDGFLGKNHTITHWVPTSMIHWLPLFIIGISVIRTIASFLSTYSVAWVGRKVVEDLRGQMFRHLLKAPTSFYDTTSSGQLISRIIYNVEQVAQVSVNSVIVIVKDSLTVIGLIIYMIYMNALLALSLLLVGPFIVFIVLHVTKRFRKISAHIQTAMGNVTHVTEQAILAHRVIKIFGGQDYETRQFERANSVNRRLNIKMVVTSAASVSLVQFIVACAIAGVVFLATSDFVGDKVTPGIFVSFIVSMAFLLGPVKRITDLNAVVQRGIAAGQNIFGLLDGEIELDTGTQNFVRAQGRIKYSNVSFMYSEDNGKVLHDVSFEIEPGQTVALVGRSGSGKSTLANLLSRFYNPTSGTILLDGYDTRSLHLASLRSQIALVSQDIILFDDTIANNIAYGALDSASEQDIIRAAEAAYAMEFIRQLPEGIHTVVGQNGVLLSGGQRQRLAIARALLKNAPVLILDEATSSLDSESERYIQAGLEKLMHERTTLVIAHRLSTIERADMIIVLHEGRIIEMGKHRDLLVQGGQYAALHKMQFSDSAS